MNVDDLRCHEPECRENRPYATRDSLRKHYQRTHDKLPPPIKMVENRVYACPECSKKFDRPQGLGIHRRRMHGVEGSSPATVAARKQRAEAPSAGSRRPVEIDGLNYMLRHLFPDGIPQKKIPAVLEWIEQTKALMR